MMINLVIHVFNRILLIQCRTWGVIRLRSQKWCGVKMKILSLSLDKNDVGKIASVMKMNLYHKWELNETGGLDLYIEDWFSGRRVYIEVS
jgi:hypothetical protein